MFGKFCISFQQLLKVAENTKTKKIILLRDDYPDVAEIIKINNSILFFNNIWSNMSFDEDVKTLSKSQIQKLTSRYGNFLLCDDKTFTKIFNELNIKIFLLNDDFDKEFEAFKKNNKKQYTQVIEKYHLNDDNSQVIYSFCLSNGSINFFTWILKNVYQHYVNFALIYQIMRWNEMYSQNANKLTKGTITAYSTNSQLLNLNNELRQIRCAKRVNDVVNTFNTKQKKILKEKTFNPIEIETLNRFSHLTGTKKQNFIRKVSTIEEFDEIMRQMAHLCDIHFNWNKESFLEYLQNADNLQYEVIFQHENVFVLKVPDYETIKRLAKTTNWCISKNKRYWNDYVENHINSVQYIIFDFNKKEDEELSIVGFTVNIKQGITHAHSFTNQNLMNERRRNTHGLISFIPMKEKNDIYTIIENLQIPLSLFTNTRTYPFDFNMDSVMNRFNQFVKKSNLNIVSKDNNRLVLILKNTDISTIFGEDIRNFFDVSWSAKKSIFFFDFNKELHNSNKFIFACIDEHHHVEYASAMYDSTFKRIEVNFDNCLQEYGIKFDIIKRLDTVAQRFIDALYSYDYITLDEILSNPHNVEEVAKNLTFNVDYCSYLYHSIFDFYSSQIIDCFIRNKVSISKIFGEEWSKRIITNIYSNTVYNFPQFGKLPTAQHYDNLANGRYQRERQILFLYHYRMLNELLAIETPNVLFQIGLNLCAMDFSAEIFNVAFKHILQAYPNVTLNNKSDYLAEFYRHCMSRHQANLCASILEIKKTVS